LVSRKTPWEFRGERYLSPWARSSSCCYEDGGNKFDLNRWDEAYFNRLKSFLKEAGERGIIVEVVLFTSFYGANWPLSPFHPGNNINNTEDLAYQQVQTLEGRSYLPLQEAYVRKMVRELNGFDNIYFEIQNEPYADNGKDAGVWNDFIQPDLLQHPGQHWRNRIEPMNDAAYAWHVWVAGLIRDEEAKLPGRHLISVNYCNFKVSIPQLDPNFDIVNFHYGMPEAVELNRHWNRPIGFNESGFSGKSDDPYRRQAWRFMMSGGSLFSHLDYSFSVGFENGQDRNYEAPGGGSPELRQQLRLLLEHLMTLNLPLASPDRNLIGNSPGAFSWAMSDRSGRWLVYCEAHAAFGLELRLPAGNYRMRWTDVRSGAIVKQEVKQSLSGTVTMAALPAMEAVLLIEAD
jgi:hypothetical protein